MLALLWPGAAAAQTPLERAGAATLAMREMTGRAAPGAVVALVRGHTVEVEAIGHEDPARERPMTADRLFGTGDLALLLTALTAVRMEAAGAVALDAPVRSIAPDLPPRVGALTLAQLLTQTAGLDDAADEPPRRPPGPAVWPGATDRALFTEPGAIHSSSRHGPPLARALLEAAAGTDFADLARRHVLEPAGMRRSTFDAARAEALGAVPGQVVSNAIFSPLQALAPRASPLRQLYTTAEDLALLIVSGTTPGGVLRDTFARVGRGAAARPAAPGDSAAMGVAVTTFAGRRMIAYQGGIGGYGTLLRWLPEHGVGVVILANATRALLAGTADALLAHALDVPLPADTLQDAGTPLPADDAALTGTYTNGDRIIVLELHAGALHWRDGDLRLGVERSGGRLEVRIADGRVAETLRWHVDDAGRSYLIVGELAYRREPARGR